MLRAEGLAVKDENLLITGGCQQALDLLCKAFLRPGDSVLLENPTYPGAIAIFASARVRCLGVPVHTETEPGATPGIDVAALEATLLSNRIKLMILTPDFHNPTGTTLPLATRNGFWKSPRAIKCRSSKITSTRVCTPKVSACLRSSSSTARTLLSRLIVFRK